MRERDSIIELFMCNGQRREKRKIERKKEMVSRTHNSPNFISRLRKKEFTIFWLVSI